MIRDDGEAPCRHTYEFISSLKEGRKNPMMRSLSTRILSATAVFSAVLVLSACSSTSQKATEAERDAARAERDALRDEHVHPPLFGSTRGPRTLGATIAITRTARTVPNADGDEWVANPDALDIATDAVPYAAGRTLTSRAGNEEFPMRAITFRGDIRRGDQRGRTGADAQNYPGRPDFRYSGVFGSFGAACTEGCE